MPARPSPATPLLLFAGLATWAVVASSAPEVIAHGAPVPWALALVVFAVAFVRSATTRGESTAALLAAQSIATVVVVASSPSSTASALFAVTAGQAPFLLGSRAALAWVMCQAVTIYAIYMQRWGAASGAVTATSFVAFQAFAIGVGTLAVREAAARLELARTNAELLATRELVTDATRIAERLRISRELHDSLGHHLTALNLHLEIARNVAEGRATEPVGRAHGLAKELLHELRHVVGTMRDDEPMDLPRALGLLARGIPTPTVHLTLPPSLVVRDHAVAHALFRCAQEAVTNTVRHANADNLWIDVAETPDGAFTMIARDDGRGAAAMEGGHGLAGLRERVASIGGRFEIESKAGAGVILRATIPARTGGRANGRP